MTSSRPRRRSALPWLLLLALAGGGAAAWRWFAPGEGGASTVPTWTVTRGPLSIRVTEGGSLQSLKSSSLVSEVEGETKILTIVPEGTTITPEDVAAGKVLVELDSADLRNKMNRQEISVSDALAGVDQSRAALDIQRNKDESDIRKAELDVRFARLDLDKYLGAAVSARVVETASTPGAPFDAKPLARVDDLGGEALQERRKLQSEIDLAKEEVSRAKDKVAWTEKLLAKGFVSQDEQVADRLALKRQEIALSQAETAIELFLAYSFPKEVERRRSDLLEAEEALLRVRKQAASSLAQATADLKGKEEKLRLEKDQFASLEKQLAACTIRANAAGLVVYASSEDRGNYRGDDSPIQAGKRVYQRQEIIRIPDPKGMGVSVKVHESALDRVRVGQIAKVTIDAYPDKPITGKVIRMSTLPDAGNRWQNPDLKVYPTDIALEDAPPALRPGMSARVEIIVDDIEGALAVPVQSVSTAGGKTAVYLRTADGSTARPVKLGRSSDRFVEVLEGLAEGDVVLLAPPKEAGGPGGDGDAKGGRGKGGRGPGERTGVPGAGTPAAGTPAAGTPGAGKRSGGPGASMDAAPPAPAGAGAGAGAPTGSAPGAPSIPKPAAPKGT